jgi:hypothetical protein
MIKPEELRIGSLIERGGQIITVSWGTFKAALDGLNIGEPIPFDKEWATRLGFEIKHDRSGGYSFNFHNNMAHFSIEFFEETPTLRIEIPTGDTGTILGFCITELKYVHHFQNIYFALTGKELTIQGKALS